MTLRPMKGKETMSMPPRELIESRISSSRGLELTQLSELQATLPLVHSSVHLHKIKTFPLSLACPIPFHVHRKLRSPYVQSGRWLTEFGSQVT